MAPIKDKGAKPTKHPGITKLADGRWLVLKTWIDPNTGRRIYRRQVVTGTIEDAQKARAAIRERGPNAKKPSRPRFKDFAEEWLGRHKRKLSGSTLERYTADVANLVVQFGDWWVDAIDYDALDKWQAEVAPDYSPATINGWHRTMRLILDAAMRSRLIATNPARDLSTLPEGRTKGARGTALSATELKAFVAAIPTCVEAETITPEMGRMLMVLAWTGMRLGEVIALRWSDVVDGEFRVERSVWRGKEKEDKTDDPRRITVVDPLRPVLEEQRRWLLTSQHPGLESGLIFPSNPQQAAAGQARRKAEHVTWYRSQSAVQVAVRDVCTQAKCPRITPHSLRRTFEDLLRAAGVEQLVRRAMAGWRSERAQGIYATVSREDRDAAAGAMIRLVLG